MSIFKCKMCGGTLEISENQTTAVCEYCGTEQTLPRLDDDRKANLYDRANHFRRNNEFDKAMSIYETILSEDSTDAEAYWSLVLCRYGIEYVEDPATHKRVPTVNRAQFTSIFDDDNYKSALQNADISQRGLYEAEARAINEIQKGILAISQKEEPFDVFICYKETDNNGRRTPDSVLANDLYHQLTQEGFKVFFARITLEDKLGSAYEPYIFAALNSAKVMVVLGTRPEYFKAVWVKNEWSRYLALVKQSGGKKVLIPAYKDMDPYDLPEEFSHLQAQDMGKLGFMQDLIRGIKKLTQVEAAAAAAPQQVVQTASGPNVQALLKRGNMALEDSEWGKAADFFDQVLNMDAECGEAYLGKALVHFKTPNLAGLVRNWDASQFIARSETLQAGKPDTEAEDRIVAEYAIPQFLEAWEVRKTLQFDFGYTSQLRSWQELRQKTNETLSGNRDLVRAEKYADATLKKQIADTNAAITASYDQKISECQSQEETQKKDLMKDYAALLQKLTRVRQLRAEAETARNTVYETGKAALEKGDFVGARKVFKRTAVSDYLDSRQMLAECVRRETEEKERRLEQMRQKKIAELEALEKHKRKVKKITIISTSTVALIVVIALLLNNVIIPSIRYNGAITLMEAGKYEEAIAAFEELNGYKDSNSKIEACKAANMDSKYNDAITLMEAGKYEEAIAAFEELNGYKDSNSKIEACKAANMDSKYNDAIALMEAGKYEEAIAAFETLDEYKDSTDRILEVKYRQAEALIGTGTAAELAMAFGGAAGYSDSWERSLSYWETFVERNTVSAGGSHTVGLKADGTIIAVGSDNFGQCKVSKWEDIVAISAGSYHTVGLKADGTVVAVGENNYGQCDVSDWENIVAISAGSGHTVGLKADGTVVAVGRHYNLYDVSEWKDIVAISAGDDYTVGLKADGTVVAVDVNGCGQCNVSEWKDIVAISAGSYHTVGLKADGTVVAVGRHYNLYDVSEWKDIVAISAGVDYTVGLKADGTVVAVGVNGCGQCNVSEWKDIVAISAGVDHAVGLKADGTVVAVGDNSNGQCKVSRWKDIKLPVNE